MFEKLLSLVPYNPGLVPQLAFYSRRMREEASIRRTGTIFLVIAFLIQFFAVLSPPQSTFASGDKNNNLIADGVNSAGHAYDHCKANTRDFQHILRHYGISCYDVSKGTNLTLTVANKPNGKDYYSMGHHPFNVAGEQHITDIPGVSVYVRPLKLAVISGTTTVDTIRLTASDNDDRVFYIMKDCGNLISIGVPTPPAPKKSGPITSTPVTPPPSSPQPNNPAPTAPPPVTPVTPPPPDKPTPCPYSPTLSLSDQNCKPCEKSADIADASACVIISKVATNATTGGNDANNTTANPGDVINYVLSVKNNGKLAVTLFKVEESLNDVLDYADVVDLHGGSKDIYNNVTWPIQRIEPGETLSHRITVKVKNPIPNTPLDPIAPNRFDLMMTNVYGNTVNIKVPGNPTKQAEVAAAALPNTGPGTTLMIGAGIVILAGYFYSRASLLARESNIAVKEAASA